MGGAEHRTDMEPHWRLHAVRAMAIVLLLLALLPESGSAFPPDSVAANSAATVDSQSSIAGPVAVSQAADDATEAPLTMTRLWSPAPNTARVEGTVATGAPIEVQVTIDGTPVRTALLEPDAVSMFTLTIDGLHAGAQTVCLDTVCDRVFVAEPEVEAASETESRIHEAADLASTYFDAALHLPGWTVEPVGENSDSGGFTNADTKSIFISANPQRSTEEFTITVLHEMGHAVDATWMDDNKRDEFRLLRSHDAALPWGEPHTSVVGDARWQYSAEDFAEVFVAWVLGGAYTTASEAVAGQPNAADLTAFCELLAFSTDC